MTYLFRFAGDDRRPQKLPMKKPAPVIKARVAPMTAIIPIIDHKQESQPVPMAPSLWAIMKEVCKLHKVLPSELAGIRKTAKLVHARRHYTVRARQETGRSFPQIAKSINKDHSSCVHYYQSWEKGASLEPFKRKPAPPRQKVSVEPKKPLERMDNTQLSDRQKIVYEYMLLGMSNRKIAEVMGRSYRQARNGTYEVRLKLKRIELENK